MDNVGEKMEDIAQLKKEIRKIILDKRDKIPSADKAKYDLAIKDIITEMEEYRQAEVILAYVSYRSEVDTTMLIQQALKDGKNVFTPKVSGSEMEFWQITAMEDLQEGYRGIREPVQGISFPDWIYGRRSITNTDKVTDKMEECARKACKVMMWMPGVAFDKERYRIGYGGGFYDRYLNRLEGNAEGAAWMRNLVGQDSFITAALAYSCQVLEQIPHEEHDRKPDLIITEQGIYC